MDNTAENRNRQYHRPVLTDEAVSRLAVAERRVYIDGTLGEGGHTQAMLTAPVHAELVLGIDLDPRSVDAARARLAEYGGRFAASQGNYADMVDIAAGKGLTQVDGVLLDLGFSSRQVEGEGYGLSFMADEPLDMRYDPEAPVDASFIVNNYEERELGQILRRYGEEPRGMAIARAVVRNRPVESTLALAALVERTIGRRPGSRMHPATRTFQALRIAVNGELENVERGLGAALSILKPGGRLAVISYHSLEDRIVKQFLVREAAECICPPRSPVCTCGHTPQVTILNRRVIKPSSEEIQSNPRSRSAKLRVAQRV